MMYRLGGRRRRWVGRIERVGRRCFWLEMRDMTDCMGYIKMRMCKFMHIRILDIHVGAYMFMLYNAMVE